MVTRFNNNTWEQLCNYKEKKHIMGAFYGSPTRIVESIPVKAKIFVLEMNNDTNTIMGVGLIKNYVKMNQHHSIYSWGNWNRFTYKGKYRISRNSMTRDELTLIEKMESKVFKTKGHLKRGQGIQSVPLDRYNQQDIQKFTQMFKDRKS
jgi:hypothetical protein